MKHQNILIVVMIAIIAVSAGAVLYDVHARNASASTSTSKKTTTASKTSTASQSKTDTSTQTKPAANQKTVVLDPGHSSVMPSGSEPVGPGASETKAKDMVGTKGVATGVTEYDFMLNLANKLKPELEKRGYKVVLTRGSGVNISAYPQAAFPPEMRFLFVGRLVRGKGVLDYLGAARIVKKSHPEVGFDLVGPFDSNPTAVKPEDIQPYIEDGTVSFHGEQKNVRPFQEASSVFVLPSYYGEGTPKSALEAMSTGRPLIVADAVGCREVVKEGVNGFLVPPKDPEAIAAAMTRLVEEPALKERMGSESRNMAEEVFDVRKVNDVICSAMGVDNA